MASSFLHLMWNGALTLSRLKNKESIVKSLEQPKKYVKGQAKKPVDTLKCHSNVLK